MPKRKLENGERRLPPQSHQSRGEIPEFASQRLGRASLTRGNVGGSHTRGKSLVETALAGCPSWIHIEPCVVPRSPLFGRFLRTFELFASPPDQVDEFRDHPPRGHPDRAANAEAWSCGWQSHYSELARREDFTANSRSWLDHAVSLDLEGREIGVPHHRWRRVKLPKPLQTEKRL